MRTLGLLALALLAVACTVKEDRTFCPAWCVVYSDGYVAEGCNGNLTCNIATGEDSNFEYGRQDYDSFTHKGNLVMEVPRNEEVYVDVFCGLEGMELIGSVLKIPMGCACDNVYSGHGQVFIQGEEGETGLPLNKDYAQITMKVNGIVDGYYPFGFRIRGNFDGYELPGGRPHRGEFDYIPKVESGNIFRAKVPRQLDDSLVLEIFHLDDGSPVTIQNLGKVIRDMGYDWNARDLKDIGIGVDVSEASFRVVIEAWEISETVTVVF